MTRLRRIHSFVDINAGLYDDPAGFARRGHGQNHPNKQAAEHWRQIGPGGSGDFYPPEFPAFSWVSVSGSHISRGTTQPFAWFSVGLRRLTSKGSFDTGGQSEPSEAGGFIIKLFQEHIFSKALLIIVSFSDSLFCSHKSCVIKGTSNSTSFGG